MNIILKKISSKNELKEYYLKYCGSISDLKNAIYSYSEGNVNSEIYNIYLIEDKNVIANYFYRNGSKKSSFCEIYIEYDENNIISLYFRGDYIYISIEYNCFLSEKDREISMIIKKRIKLN